MGEVRGQGHDWTQGRRPVPRLHQAASRAPTSRGRAASLEVAAHSGGFSGLGTSLRRCSSMHTHPPAARTGCTQPGESWTKVASTVAGQARVCGIRDHRCWRGYGAGLSGDLDPWSLVKEHPQGRAPHARPGAPASNSRCGGASPVADRRCGVGGHPLHVGSPATPQPVVQARRELKSGLQRSPAPVTGEPRRS